MSQAIGSSLWEVGLTLPTPEPHRPQEAPLLSEGPAVPPTLAAPGLLRTGPRASILRVSGEEWEGLALISAPLYGVPASQSWLEFLEVREPADCAVRVVSSLSTDWPPEPA